MTATSILISTIRNVIPNAIANSIIGVQPMTGPIGQIFTLKSHYSMNYTSLPRIKMNKEQYKVFLRLNDRKKCQTENDFTKANYPGIYMRYIESVDWCTEQFGANGYARYYNKIWFENENDLMAYKLRWTDID